MRHLVICKGKIKDVICHDCESPNDFGTLWALNRHQVNVHQTRKCRYCKYKFADEELKVHQESCTNNTGQLLVKIKKKSAKERENRKEREW